MQQCDKKINMHRAKMRIFWNCQLTKEETTTKRMQRLKILLQIVTHSQIVCALEAIANTMYFSFSLQISRQSIDACKDYFRDDLIKADWALMVELKKLFEIL